MANTRDPDGSEDRPRQAVVLAGGRGTRLLPLTKTIPKPMVAFHGRPFLEYLILQLKEQGFERVLMLLGYLPDKIIEHFGDGSRFGLAISYSVSSADDETGERLRKARERIEPIFMFFYCDNFVPFDIAAMWRKWRGTDGVAALVTVYTNKDAYTRSNLRIGPDERVECYDKSRTSPDLAGVDIGYMIARSDIVDLVPEGNVSFEANVYPELVARRRLFAFPTDHRYYSVGDHKRLPATELFLAARKAVILDRDGVLNKRMPRACYVRTWDEWEWLPGARDAIAELTSKNYLVFIVTNQPGIARGAMTAEALDVIHARMRADVEAAGGRITAIYHCPHDWDEGCECRKPAPGMLFAAQREHALDLTKCVFIGDDSRDEEAAVRARCPFRYVTDETSLAQIVKDFH